MSRIDWRAIATPPRVVWVSLKMRSAEVAQYTTRKDHDFWAVELDALDRAYFLAGLVNHDGEAFDNRRGAK
jgi:hypothetical protein